MMDKKALEAAVSHVKIALTAAVEGTLDVGPLIDVDETARKTAQVVIGIYLSATTGDGGELVSRLQKREREARDIMHQSIFADELRDYIDRLVALEVKCAERTREREELRKYCSAAAIDFELLLNAMSECVGTSFADAFRRTASEMRETSEFLRLSAEGRQNNLLYEDELSAERATRRSTESVLAAERERVKRLEDIARCMLDDLDHDSPINPTSHEHQVLRAALSQKEPSNG